MKSTSGKRLGYFYMNADESVNIDTPMDFETAEILLKKRTGQQNI
jgi:CMP-N-acetylneuraminic acid synthetase